MAPLVHRLSNNCAKIDLTKTNTSRKEIYAMSITHINK
jgi:hypothetical protein